MFTVLEFVVECNVIILPAIKIGPYSLLGQSSTSPLFEMFEGHSHT
jgi:hypothetical protein